VAGSEKANGFAGGAPMGGFNQAVLLGRLVAPPEELTTKNGKLFIKAIIAASVYQKNNSDSTSEERTSFVPVTIFGRTAEVFLKHVHKGEMVHVVGRLEGNEWKTDSGEKRLSLSFVVEQLNLLGQGVKSKPSIEPAKTTDSQARHTAPRSSPAKPKVDENGDPTTIPF
jgi:single-strand DNA-binding protein